MIRIGRRVLVVTGYNLLLAVLWWAFTRPRVDIDGQIPALFALLLMAILGLTVFPFALWHVWRRRWMLMVMIAMVLLFWCLQWIDAVHDYSSFAPEYALRRRQILASMGLSLAVVISGYAGLELYFRRRRDHGPREPA